MIFGWGKSIPFFFFKGLSEGIISLALSFPSFCPIAGIFQGWQGFFFIEKEKHRKRKKE